jgi:hypothetical protein
VLRTIVADRSIGEEWLIDAFLNGMSNPDSATHVRGREPATLDEAVRMAIRQVGKFGEGLCVGLEEAMVKQDTRRASGPRTPLGAPSPLGSTGQKRAPGAGGPANLGMMGFGQLPPQKPPRYDAEGRLVSPMGVAAVGGGVGFLPPGYAVPLAQQGYVVPPGYALVPLGTGSPAGSSKIQTSGSTGNPSADGQRPPQNSGQHGPGRRGGRVNQVGAGQNQAAPLGTRGGSGSRYGPPPLKTKEDRLANYRRYVGAKNPTPPPDGQTPGFSCFYFGYAGHFARNCRLKQQDLAAEGQGQNLKEEGEDKTAENGQRS